MALSHHAASIDARGALSLGCNVREANMNEIVTLSVLSRQLSYRPRGQQRKRAVYFISFRLDGCCRVL
jgi:hypothetical protein